MVLEQLSRGDCLRLMASVPVGRMVYTRRALPAVDLVNFVMDDGDVVIRTDSGGKLAAAAHNAVVAFEADSIDIPGHAGWSVTVVGYAEPVTGAAQVRRLQETASAPWAPGRRDHFIRITPTLVDGTRLRSRQETGDSHARGL